VSTSRDVAKAAGVSVATVSRAFSEKAAVSSATRRHVLAVADRLGYSPDPAARRLTTGRSGNIGLIVPDLSNPFFADVAKGVQRRARDRRRSIFISDTDEQARLEADAVRHLARQVDGIIWASPRLSDEALAELRPMVPVVLLHRSSPGWWSVTAEYREGMRQTLVNLHALGHRTVAYAGGPAASWSGAQRLDGLRTAAADLAITLVELGSVAPTIDGGLAAADLVLATEATALVAYNDAVGLGAMARLAARGVKVPDDLSVVGCDDTMLSRLTLPPMTTVNVPRYEAGDVALSLLEQQMESPSDDPVAQVLPTHLVIRGTTAPPPAKKGS
jgi:LacI family transcriptional regulator